MSNASIQVANKLLTAAEIAEDAARFIRDRRADRLTAVRRVVLTGNLMAHAIAELAEEIEATNNIPGEPIKINASRERELLQLWEDALAALRGSLEPRP